MKGAARKMIKVIMIFHHFNQLAILSTHMMQNHFLPFTITVFHVRRPSILHVSQILNTQLDIGALHDDVAPVPGHFSPNRVFAKRNT